jgi:hypothetical protein
MTKKPDGYVLTVVSRDDLCHLASYAWNQVDNYHDEGLDGCPNQEDCEALGEVLDRLIEDEGLAFPAVITITNISHAMAVQLQNCIEQAQECPDLFTDEDDGRPGEDFHPECSLSPNPTPVWVSENDWLDLGEHGRVRSQWRGGLHKPMRAEDAVAIAMVELERAMERNRDPEKAGQLAAAISTLEGIYKQRGTEELEPNAHTLCDLCDIAVYG